jgi:uncharacterized protein (DUF924 family)
VDAAQAGALTGWLTGARTTLAYIVATDQFPRNIFRGDGRSFALDPAARAAAKSAVSRGWDISIGEPARQFFYMPLMHSEILSDQERCVRLMLIRLPATGADNLRHARAHREVIRRFGRFPHRNVDLGRASSVAEGAFLDRGGYGTILNELSEPA